MNGVVRKISFSFLVGVLFLSCAVVSGASSRALDRLLDDMKLYKLDRGVNLGANPQNHPGDLYQHSMWVYNAAYDFIENQSPYAKGIVLSDREKKVFCLAALLHDVAKAGRIELFNKTHPKLAYNVERDDSGNIISVLYTGDFQEHCVVGFEFLAGKFLSKDCDFISRNYVMHDGTYFDFDTLFEELEITQEERKLIAILVGMHWALGNLRQGTMTNQDFLDKLKKFACAIDFQHGDIDYKLLRLAILIQVVDVRGITPCNTLCNHFFANPISIEPVCQPSDPYNFVLYGYEDLEGKEPKALTVMNNLIDFYLNQSRKYRNIIFDIGGVLVHFNIAKTVQAMRDQGKNIPQEVAEKVVVANHMQEHLEYNRGVLTQDEYIRQVAKKLFTEQSHQDMAIEILSLAESRLVPLDDGLALLKLVKDHGYKVYALSNLTHGSYQEIISHKADFFDPFDGAILSYKVKSVKPEPMIYQALLQEYNLDPAKCFFLDDVAMNIAAAKSLGIDGVVYQSSQQVLRDLVLAQILPGNLVS